MRTFKYIGIIASILVLHFFLFYTSIIENLDYKIYDFFQESNVDKPLKSHHVVIIDIDDESLKEFGQWPWPRIVTAKLINQVSLLKPTTIGINIAFPEKDRTSPINIQKFYQNFFNYTIEMPTLDKVLKDNDLLLIQSVIDTKSTLSVSFLEENQHLESCHHLEMSAYKFKSIKSAFSSNLIRCNHEELQSAVNSFGFSNTKVDRDGFFRRVSLFGYYKKDLLPAFGLSTLLTIDPLIEGKRENYFSLLGHEVELDKEGSVLLNFNSKLSPSWSAVDILQNRVPLSAIQGKIVLIGSSALTLNHKLLPNYQKVSNTMIHATSIENILNEDLYLQPQYYKTINFLISLLVSFIMVWFLFKHWYSLILILFLFVILSSLLITWSFYINHIYISMGYLWVPLIAFFFILSIFFIFLYTKEQEEAHKALLESHTAMLDSMVFIATLHDEETGAHILRTKNYVKLLAEYFYAHKMYLNILTPSYINSMYEAAPLHDIGKIGIPDAILKKVGKLTTEEFEIMKTHPTLGKNVIQNTMKVYDKNDFLKVAYNIAYYHHEKWDGTGYPIGLKGDAIPLEAQFMTLADVYDALISKRRYKEAFTFEMAEEMIISGSGRTYNPKVIEAFIVLKEEFREVSLKWKDE